MFKQVISIEITSLGRMNLMSKKKKRDEKESFTLYPTDGSFPDVTCKITIKKSKTKRKINVKDELEDTQMDMMQ